jgi:hypothetical protein
MKLPENYADAIQVNTDELEKTNGLEYVIGRYSEPGYQCVLRVIDADKIRTKALRWHVPDKIPKGKITFFTGLPGPGKTLTAMDITMRTITGSKWIDGSKNTAGPQKVLIASTEDALEDTLIPRLKASLKFHANLDDVPVGMVKVITNVGVRDLIEGSGSDKPVTLNQQFNLDAHIELLKATLLANPDITLLMLDPITGFFGIKNINKDEDMRPMLEAVCNATGVTLIGVIHCNKRSDVSAVQKVLGASSVAGVARAIWNFSVDPDDKEECYMSLVKGNLSKNRKGMKYKKVGADLMQDDGVIANVPHVEWLGETEEDADDVLSKERAKAKDGGQDGFLKSDEATIFVLSELENGPRKMREIHEAREKLKISEPTFKRAYRKLGVKVEQEPGAKTWWMALTDSELPWVKEKETQVSLAKMAEEEGL